MALFGPFFEGVLSRSLARAYLNLLFFERGPKLGLKKGVKNGGLRGSIWGHFWPQMLENVPNAQCGRNFFKKWYLWCIFLQNGVPCYFPRCFSKVPKPSFLTFLTLFRPFFIKNDHFWHFSNLRKWMRTLLGHISPKMTKNVIFAKTIFSKTFFTKSFYRTFASLKNVKNDKKRHF